MNSFLQLLLTVSLEIFEIEDLALRTRSTLDC